jgi:hypothetical protein
MFRRLLAGAALAVTLAAPVRAADADPILPAATESVVFVNVRQVIDSDVVKKFALGQIKQALQGNDAKKMLEELGLDPLKDIDKVTVASWGSAEEMNFVGAIRGKFDKEKLTAAAKKHAEAKSDELSVVKEGDLEIFKVTPKNQQSDKPFYATVADDKTIVVGSDKKVVATGVAAAKGTKAELKKEIAALLAKQDEKASMFMCALIEGKAEGLQLPPNVNIPGVDGAKLSKQLAKMTTAAMTLRVTDEIGVEVAMGMKDTDSADEFGDTVSNLIGTVKQFLPFLTAQQPQAKPLVDEINKTLKSSVKDKDVKLTLKISADAIGKATGGGD